MICALIANALRRRLAGLAWLVDEFALAEMQAAKAAQRNAQPAEAAGTSGEKRRDAVAGKQAA
jgi:hypothetical protein